MPQQEQQQAPELKRRDFGKRGIGQREDFAPRQIKVQEDLEENKNELHQ